MTQCNAARSTEEAIYDDADEKIGRLADTVRRISADRSICMQERLYAVRKLEQARVRRQQDLKYRVPGLAWLDSEVARAEAVVASYDRAIAELDEGADRARREREQIESRRRADNRTQLVTSARPRAVHVVRVNRHTRARRVVRVVAKKTTAKAAADPDPESSTRALRGSAGGVA
jgi:hypothetical protein